MSIGIFQNKNNQPPRTVDLSIQKKLSQENSQSTSCPSQQQSTQNIITQQPQKPTHRSSHRRCSLRKGILRNFAKFIGKRPCQSFFFWHGYFPVNFEKFFKNTFFTEHIWETASKFKISSTHQSQKKKKYSFYG